MAEPLLSFNNVRAGYGEAVVLDDISFETVSYTHLTLPTKRIV